MLICLLAASTDVRHISVYLLPVLLGPCLHKYGPAVRPTHNDQLTKPVLLFSKSAAARTDCFLRQVTWSYTNWSCLFPSLLSGAWRENGGCFQEFLSKPFIFKCFFSYSKSHWAFFEVTCCTECLWRVPLHHSHMSEDVFEYFYSN